MKRKPVVTRYKADDDIDETFEYYLSEAGPDVAEAFINEYELATSHLTQFPLSGSPLVGHTLGIEDLRQWSLSRFPYFIYYFDRENFVEVWRVLHGHRDVATQLRDAE